MSDADRIREACITAAGELGVRIVTPFSLMDRDGLPVEFIALFPDFGGVKGTVVCDFRDWEAKRPVADLNGFYCSGLHPESYGKYEREHFVDALDEWGWHGSSSERPKWLPQGERGA